jgi:hypothetical protein
MRPAAWSHREVCAACVQLNLGVSHNGYEEICSEETGGEEKVPGTQSPQGFQEAGHEEDGRQAPGPPQGPGTQVGCEEDGGEEVAGEARGTQAGQEGGQESGEEAGSEKGQAACEKEIGCQESGEKTCCQEEGVAQEGQEARNDRSRCPGSTEARSRAGSLAVPGFR